MSLFSSRATRFVWVVAAVLVFYAAGVAARWRYGAMIVVRNESGQYLRNVAVKVETIGKRHTLGDIPPGGRHRIFVDPAGGDSHINLEFTDARSQPHVETVVGYVEPGYCGKAKATIRLSGEIDLEDATTIGPCWKSWLDFF